MKLTKTKELLEQISQMEIPVSDTMKGKLVHQTFRNKLTSQLKQTLYEDFAESLLEEGYIIPYLIKEGVILEIPNESIANSLGPDDLGSGALSIEFDIAIKGLETDATELANEFEWKKQLDAQKAIQKEKERKVSFAKQQAIREAKAKRTNKMQELVNQIGAKG